MYRLHVDIPLSKDLDQSIDLSKQIVDFLSTLKINGVDVVQYKLSNDTDRANKNYLDINENGHASNKKMQIKFHDQ